MILGPGIYTPIQVEDLDTGGGTDNHGVVGLVYAASGGASLVSAANPLPVTLGAGSAAIGSINIRNTDGTDNSYTSGGVYGQKVHVVGISDLYAEGTIAAGSSLTGHKPVATGFKDATGNNQFDLGDTTNGRWTNVKATVGLTDTQLRATAVPVSGTVTANLSATDNAVLDDIALKVNDNLDGTGTHGTRDLTSANTWYAVPSTVPTNPYILIAQPRTGNAGTVRWSFLSSGTPGAGTGLEIQGNLVLRLAANDSVVFASTTAGDDVDWTCKEIA